MSDLTASQQRALAVLDRVPTVGAALAARAEYDGSLEGFTITLSSLVRRGIAERRRRGASGRVHYVLTDRGAAAQRTYR